MTVPNPTHQLAEIVEQLEIILHDTKKLPRPQDVKARELSDYMNTVENMRSRVGIAYRMAKGLLENDE